ncbi:MAG: multidrug efflux SMR transporter [Bacteriovoracaceae bacterium]|nr:multidrug efflux SMR transporter [Bacteriovoracaceae bacterium]
MAYLYLFLAACFEAGWPIGMKLASVTGRHALYLFMAAITMMLSGFFLYLAQRNLPIGMAYSIWTGFGCIAVMLISCLFFGEHLSVVKIVGMISILAGMALLELSTRNA